MTATTRTLYTPAILVAATTLTEFPWDEALPWRGEARSRRCGSTLALGLGVDGEGRINKIGLRVHACAIGQASAQVFASAVVGRTKDDIAAARAAMVTWLAGETAPPDWPGILLIVPAVAYPARHDAVLLAWDAALSALV
jgi:NifU-like protein involved in Fe-S cluster formation